MDKATFELGREIRSSVLGKEFVDAAFKAADDFNMPMQELVTEYCWGAVWGRPGLDKKQRSMLNLAMISCLNRPHELRLHIAGALKNGVTRDEIREIFMQVAIYAGVPAGVDSFRAAKEVFEKAFITETDIDFKKKYEDDKLQWTEKPDWKDGAPQALYAAVVCVFCLVSAYLVAKLAGYDIGTAVGLYAGSQTISASVGLGTDAINRLGLPRGKPQNCWTGCRSLMAPATSSAPPGPLL